MSLESRFRAGLLADAGVIAAVRGGIWPQLKQNPTYPCAVYKRVTTTRIYSMNQAGNPRWGDCGYVRFQVDVMSADPDDGQKDAIAAADAIRAALKTFDLSLETGKTFEAAPNEVVNERAGDLPDTYPPVFSQMLDIKCFFRDQ